MPDSKTKLGLTPGYRLLRHALNVSRIVGGRLRKLSVQLAVVIPVGLVLILLVQDIIDPDVILQSITVPKTMTDAGLDSNVIALELKDAVAAVESDALVPEVAASLNRSKDLRGFAAQKDLPDFTVPQSTLSVATAASFLRGLFSNRGKIISGEIVQPTGKGLTLILRIDGERLNDVTVSDVGDIKDLMLQGAQRIVGKLKPAELAAYYFVQNRQDEALSLARDVARSKPLPNGHADVEIALANSIWGEVLVRRGDLPEGLERMRIASQFDTDDEWPMNDLGRAEQGANMYSEAERDYLAATQRRTHSATAYLNLGYIYQVERRFRDSIESLTIALKTCQPADCSEAYNNIGWDYVQLHDDADALPNFRQAVVYDPSYTRPIGNLAELLVRGHKTKEAAFYFNELGQTQLKNNNYPMAVDAYQNVTKLIPDNSYFWVMYGYSLKSVNRNADAIAAYSNALRLDPIYVDAYLSRSRAYTAAAQAESDPNARLQLWQKACNDIKATRAVAAKSGQTISSNDLFADAAAIGTNSGNQFVCTL